MISAFGVEHGEISKNNAMYFVPRSKKEQRKSRAKGAAESGAIGAAGSSGLTYLFGRGMPYRNKTSLVAGGVGGGVSALAGATGPEHKRKLVPAKKEG